MSYLSLSSILTSFKFELHLLDYFLFFTQLPSFLHSHSLKFLETQSFFSQAIHSLKSLTAGPVQLHSLQNG